ncbi:hypothetical protein F7725_026476 [Dissostichus mawsoni]|uniref:Uncharacterized protein n=1 Tax=Dissostichus mawsoni TaxID=36200 RepID=A0A7J5X775_DISMA|nr:hypothetical protein F7725_026476 [Dissostichus mawsoni]
MTKHPFISSLTMNPARLSNLSWKSFHSSSPLTLPAFSALNICSSVSGCREASATFSTGSTSSKASLSGKLTRHISRARWPLWNRSRVSCRYRIEPWLRVDRWLLNLLRSS